MRAPRISPKLFAAWLLACACLGGLLSWFSGMPLWAGMLLVAAGLIVNGLIADIEDEAPGGFPKPRQKDK
jgi:hypothetical protein